MSESARIMIYSQDSYGLGHLRRTTNVANALVKQRKNLTVLIAVDSPVAPFFELSERIDFIKLPTVVKVDARASTIQLRDDGGRTGVVHVDGDMIDLDALKPGDLVEIDFLVPEPGSNKLQAGGIWLVQR